ncbi:hypothetical protein V1478_012853 [Vespula squamosa]|uniref:Uncharacterized protein n=1 Tax=Vespula squamosa TaxID=30214 RepID=A0ABD2A947_VESSQ
MAMPVSVGYAFSFLLVHAGVKTDENKDTSIGIRAYVCTHVRTAMVATMVSVLVLGSDVGVGDGGDGGGGSSGVPRK